MGNFYPSHIFGPRITASTGARCEHVCLRFFAARVRFMAEEEMERASELTEAKLFAPLIAPDIRLSAREISRGREC